MGVSWKMLRDSIEVNMMSNSLDQTQTRRFRLKLPTKKTTNPGGDCYWVGGEANLFIEHALNTWKYQVQIL